MKYLRFRIVMKTKVGLIFWGIGLMSVMVSCFKGETFPEEPIISDATVLITNDSAVLSFSFTDGDGDIGLSDNELDPPYDSSSFYHFNLYVGYFEKQDGGGWEPGLDLEGDTIVFTYRLEPILVQGKEKGIKGTMDVVMNPFYNAISPDSDTIKYSVQLIDRALNESQIIETDPVIR